jgi:hypothetical protein
MHKTMTNIRNLVGKTKEEINFFVDGIAVREVTKRETSPGYFVYLGNGELIPVKGHDRLEDIKRFKPVSSNARIRRYGKFGSTIN